MRFYYTILFLLLISSYSYAQIKIEKWVKRNIDSLHTQHVDTLLYYNEYCNECNIAKAIPCSVIGYNIEIEIIIIYRQHGKYYCLKFNCYYPPLKKQLNGCSSIPYSISIIPTLNLRDKVFKRMRKKGKFLPPQIIDGTHESAQIYYGKKTQTVSMSEDMPEELLKDWQIYFWFRKEVQLLKLINKDIALTNN